MAYMRELNMKVTASKDELLAKLTENRENHKKIVEEARIGYAALAKEELKSKLAALEEGKLVNLRSKLVMPQEHLGVYDTAIQMLQLHIGQHIELTAGEVRSLVMDEWDWLAGFLQSSSIYAPSSVDYARAKGVALGVGDE